MLRWHTSSFAIFGFYYACSWDKLTFAGYAYMSEVGAWSILILMFNLVTCYHFRKDQEGQEGWAYIENIMQPVDTVEICTADDDHADNVAAYLQ